MFDSFGRSWQLVKASWAVLSSDKELILFPIVSMIVMIIVSIFFLLPASVVFGLLGAGAGEDASKVMGYVILFAFYLVSNTIAIYFNVGLIGAAMIRLDGGNPTLGDGFRIANERLGKIIGYAAITATVGVILRWLEEQKLIGQIVSSVIGLAWNLATFLAIPILVAQDVGPIDAVKQSAALLKKTWGEQISGNFSLGGVFLLIYLAIIFVGVGLIVLAVSTESGLFIALAIGLLVVSLVVVGVINGALSGIFQATLYRYAETGIAPDNFDIDTIRGAFKEKKKKF